MMKLYAAPQIDWIRFEVDDIMLTGESGVSGETSSDFGDQINVGQGEAEPW